MRRSTRAFTLIETMVVVSLVGVLAVLATVAYRRWVRTAYLAEAQGMVANIRSAEDAFRSENGGYLNISQSLGPGFDYPAATPGAFKTVWGAPCGSCTAQWTALNVQANAPLAFGYSVVANNVGAPTISKTVNGKALDLSAMTAPWYFIEADGDINGDGVFTHVYGMSATNQIFIDAEGE